MRLRLQGMKINIHQWEFERGEMFIAEEFDPELNRHVRTASLKRDGRDVFPPLRDVEIVAMNSTFMTLTGYEHEPRLLSSPISYQQSWLVRSPYINDALEEVRTAQSRRG